MKGGEVRREARIEKTPKYVEPKTTDQQIIEIAFIDKSTEHLKLLVVFYGQYQFENFA